MDKEIAVGEPAVPVEEDGPVEEADEDRHDEGLAGEGPAQQNQPAHQEGCEHAQQALQFFFMSNCFTVQRHTAKKS